MPIRSLEKCQLTEGLQKPNDVHNIVERKNPDESDRIMQTDITPGTCGYRRDNCGYRRDSHDI
jgi:hypothetical protein